MNVQFVRKRIKFKTSVRLDDIDNVLSAERSQKVTDKVINERVVGDGSLISLNG